ncbi:hypothetical protein F4819DRAFT_496425 [Hypoxylon fuscum]|nr:hypothetical protein F4819DRAFT_496425 [Hypoxylon fuscum]
MECIPNEVDSEKMVVPGNMTTTICHAICTALGEQKVALLGSPAYNASVASYFSEQQEALQPACIVSPQTAEDVSATIRTLTSYPNGQCNFAIRSGGHASWAGASNIADGVVIDIRALNSVDVHSDTSTVSVGAGASWDDVYAKLDPIGLSVNGGRAAGVGVSGLTLGGGISYFSPRYGWTCDTVTSIEIVLADASIVEANADSDPALFQALKGGNNNFGVVTRIDFSTFTQGLIWTGNVYNNLSIADDVISELVKICSADAYDEYASIITTFGYSQARGLAVISSVLEYTKEVDSPPIYQDLLSLPNLMSTSQLMNMTTLAKTTQAYSPEHPRSINRVRTLVLSTTVIKAAYAQWEASLPSIRDVSNLVWAFALEPLPPKIYGRHAEENALGLADRSGSLVVALLTVTWTEACDDALVNDAAKKLMDAIENKAQQLGDLDPFIYLNYADKDQDPISSYGKASVDRLRAVQERVDPKGIFTNQVPGGYKIPGK